MGDGEFWPLTESKPMSRLQQNSAQLITSAGGHPKPNLVQIYPLGASGHMGEINVKKLQFIHKLTASDTSKTAKITKRWYYPPAHRLNVNVLLNNRPITFLQFFTFIFAVLLHFWVITAKGPFGLPSQIMHPNRNWWCESVFSLFPLKFSVWFHLVDYNMRTPQFLMARRIHCCIITIMGRGVVLS